MEGQLRTQLAMQIFQKTRHNLDLYQEATVYKFPVGLLGLPFDLPKSSEKLTPLSDILHSSGGNWTSKSNSTQQQHQQPQKQKFFKTYKQPVW